MTMQSRAQTVCIQLIETLPYGCSILKTKRSLREDHADTKIHHNSSSPTCPSAPHLNLYPSYRAPPCESTNYSVNRDSGENNPSSTSSTTGARTEKLPPTPKTLKTYLNRTAEAKMGPLGLYLRVEWTYVGKDVGTPSTTETGFRVHSSTS